MGDYISEIWRGMCKVSISTIPVSRREGGGGEEEGEERGEGGGRGEKEREGEREGEKEGGGGGRESSGRGDRSM